MKTVAKLFISLIFLSGPLCWAAEEHEDKMATDIKKEFSSVPENKNDPTESAADEAARKDKALSSFVAKSKNNQQLSQAQKEKYQNIRVMDSYGTVKIGAQCSVVVPDMIEIARHVCFKTEPHSYVILRNEYFDELIIYPDSMISIESNFNNEPFWGAIHLKSGGIFMRSLKKTRVLTPLSETEILAGVEVGVQMNLDDLSQSWYADKRKSGVDTETLLKFGILGQKEDYSLKSGEVAQFEGVRENGEIVYDLFLKDKKTPRGDLWIRKTDQTAADKKISDKKLSELLERLKKEFSIVQLKNEKSSSAAQQKKAKAAEDSKFLCHIPNGQMNDCAYSCTQWSSKDRRCNGSCSLKKCLASGQWGSPQSKVNSDCSAQSAVKKCDF